ncbi:uncharacterized protein LOC116194172 [Punica granatum]|uniref:Uncharacterized protein LOC116194172 n=1 Tax=Punica granatum TaxID=22663 RepID=A0A6P8C8K4_PUNGR|nr:uncharacterized protein LOC116194172 [Punica granatum]
MQPTSKELLQLEEKDTISSIESSLRICDEKSSASQKKQAHPDRKPAIGQVPKSQVLGKVQDFLGVLSEANKKLQLEAKDNPEEFDIEALNGNESEVIELDLMLGIADLHTPEAVAAAEASVSGYQPPVPLFGNDSETDSDSSSSDEDGDNDNENEENDGEKKKDLPSQPQRSKSGEDDSGEIIKKGSKKRPRIIELS